MHHHRFVLPALCAAGAALGLAACDNGGTASLELHITDAPSDYIESAEIWVSRVYLQGGNEEPDGGADNGGRVDLFNDLENPMYYDLLQLQDGVTAVLTEASTIPEGPYAQLRLVVDSARVTLKSEYMFENGAQTTTLSVPSGSSSGIKVQLAGPLPADDGSSTTLTVDVPVDENFVIQGNPDAPGGMQGMTFTPLLRELTRESN